MKDQTQILSWNTFGLLLKLELLKEKDTAASKVQWSNTLTIKEVDGWPSSDGEVDTGQRNDRVDDKAGDHSDHVVSKGFGRRVPENKWRFPI